MWQPELYRQFHRQAHQQPGSGFVKPMDLISINSLEHSRLGSVGKPFSHVNICISNKISGENEDDDRQRDLAVDAAVANVNQRLPDYAQISKWISAEKPFSFSNGQLSRVGTICRQKIQADYISLLETIMHTHRPQSIDPINRHEPRGINQ
jgi:hypothetical protein